MKGIKSRTSHVCRESKTCCCYPLADEPDDDCPVHAGGPWPPRCEICGRFIKRKHEYYEDVYNHGR